MLVLATLRYVNQLLIEFALSKYQKVNKHPKVIDNFDIRCQLEHLNYDMNHTLKEYVMFLSNHSIVQENIGNKGK